MSGPALGHWWEPSHGWKSANTSLCLQRQGVSKLWAQGGPPATFVNEVVLDAATPIHLHIVSSYFCTRLSGAVRTETGRPPKPKIPPVWTFTESVLSPAQMTAFHTGIK